MKQIFLLLFVFQLIFSCDSKDDRNKIEKTEEPFILSPSHILGQWEYVYSIIGQDTFISKESYRAPHRIHYIKIDTIEYQMVQSNVRHQISTNKFKGIGMFLFREVSDESIKCYPVQYERGDIMHWAKDGSKEFHIRVERIKNDTLIQSDDYSYKSDKKDKQKHYYVRIE